jgi:hypothetical protein
MSNDIIIPYGIGTWIYDELYVGTKKDKVIPGMFVGNLTAYNQATNNAFLITQTFAYGGDVEIYCRGSGESSTSDKCTDTTVLTTYPGSEKDNFIGRKTQDAYLKVPGVNEHIIILDGRVDLTINKEYDYLDHINTLPEDEAILFANVVSKAVCGDDSVAGVQFDIEPFSFTGEGGSFQGPGQKYFYSQIAKNFAGWNDSPGEQKGINADLSSDPLGCVNTNHPNGRTFSVFTFAKCVTPDVVEVLKSYSNGYVMDSLYDLGPLPGGQLNSVDDFRKYAIQEIADMKAKGVPYQFAIPAAASAHEFETGPVPGVGAGNQIQYIKAAIEEINPNVLKTTDPNFKGIGVWSWNQKMIWHGGEYTPAYPPENILTYFQTINQNCMGSAGDDITDSHDEL